MPSRSSNLTTKDFFLKGLFLLLFVSVFILWWYLRMHYRIGYYGEDAPGYVTEAIDFATGIWEPRDFVNGLNIGTYIPVGLCIRFFGKSETILMLWPLICSLIGMLSVGGITFLLLGIHYAIIAAFIYATYPGDIIFSTVVMPDSIQTGLFSFSLFFTVLGEKLFPRGKNIFYFLSGIILGFSYLVRANAIILLPVLICSTFISLNHKSGIKQILFSSLCIFSGFIFIMLLEGGFYSFHGKPFLHRFIAVAAHYGKSSSIETWGLNVDLTYMPKVLLPCILWFINHEPLFSLNIDQSLHGIFYGYLFILLAGLLISICKKKNVNLIFVSLLWFIMPVFYHEFGSQSLTHYVLIHRLSRHFILFLPVAIFLFSFSMKQVCTIAPPSKYLKYLYGAGLFLILSNIFWMALKGVAIYHQHVYTAKNIDYRIVKELSGYQGKVVADSGNLGAIIFFLNQLDKTAILPTDIQTISSCKELNNAILIINSTYGWWSDNDAIRNLKRRLPCIESPPGNWQEIKTIGPEKIYKIRGD
jgi:hypothetical protein